MCFFCLWYHQIFNITIKSNMVKYLSFLYQYISYYLSLTSEKRNNFSNRLNKLQTQNFAINWKWKAISWCLYSIRCSCNCCYVFIGSLSTNKQKPITNHKSVERSCIQFKYLLYFIEFIPLFIQIIWDRENAIIFN